MTDYLVSIIEDGLMAFQAISKDREFTVIGAKAVAPLKREIEAHVNPGDRCLLAFPTTAVLPDAQTVTGLALIMEDRLLLPWYAGLFRPKKGTTRIFRSEITDVTWGSGTNPHTQQATMLTVRHGSLATELGVPRTRTKVIAGAVKSALLTGTVEIPAEAKPELGPSGRPPRIEEGIARWFAFRRGEITQDSVGVRPIELLRWMTEEERNLDAELVRASKARK